MKFCYILKKWAVFVKNVKNYKCFSSGMKLRIIHFTYQTQYLWPTPGWFSQKLTSISNYGQKIQVSKSFSKIRSFGYNSKLMLIFGLFIFFLFFFLAKIRFWGRQRFDISSKNRFKEIITPTLILCFSCPIFDAIVIFENIWNNDL
jgi:hypothetical protein